MLRERILTQKNRHCRMSLSSRAKEAKLRGSENTMMVQKLGDSGWQERGECEDHVPFVKGYKLSVIK